jgi:hypothetical protein
MRRLLSRAIIIGSMSFFLMIIYPMIRGYAQTTQINELPIYLPLVINRYDTAIHWESMQFLKLSINPYGKPVLVIDSQGRPHIFGIILSSSGQNGSIYHTYQSDQGWIAPEPISQDPGESKILCPPIVAPDGRILFLWQNRKNYSAPFRLLFSSWDNGKWSVEEELLSYVVDSDAFGIIRLDAQGSIHVFMRSNPGFDILHRVRTAAGWSATQSIHDSVPGDDLTWPDEKGGLRLYTDNYQDQLSYSYWINGRFLIQAKPLAGLISRRSSLLDGADNLHLFKVNPIPNYPRNIESIYHQCLSNDLNWDDEKVISGDTYVFLHEAARDEAAGFGLAWNEMFPRQVYLSIWDQCNQTHMVSTPLPDIKSLQNSLGWGGVQALALRDQPGKVCMLMVPAIYDPAFDYALQCASIQ